MNYAQNSRDIGLVNEGRVSERAKMAIALENCRSDRSHTVENISDLDVRLSCQQGGY